MLYDEYYILACDVVQFGITCRLGGPGSIPGQSVWYLWWTKSHCYMFLSEYFKFDLLVSLHPSPCLFFHLSPTLYDIKN
jgi:hypothetical protein